MRSRLRLQSVLIVALLALLVALYVWIRPAEETIVLVTTTSPERTREARLVAWMWEGMLVKVTDFQVVISRPGEPGSGERAFSTYADDRDVAFHWLDDHALDVTICNTCGVLGLKREVMGVRINVHFIPDDPQARRRHLEEQKIPREHYIDYNLEP